MLTLDTWQDSQFDDVLAIDLITHWAQVTPNAIAWKSEQASLSWQQLAQLIQSKAKAMVQQGVESGQVIALVGKNSPELVLTYLASLTLGMTPALIAPAPECTIVQKCQQVGARWRCQQTQLDAPAQLTPISQAQPMTSFHAASLVFTSGSTGHPKAVAHASKAHLASAQGLLAEFEFTPTDIWLLSLPIYHVSGLGIIWRWLYRGACLQHASDDLIADLAKVTHASLVAVQLARFLDAKGCREPNQLKRVLLGGSHIPFELTQKASKAGIDTWLGYGMTETASTVTAKRCDGTESAGRILPNRQLKIDNGQIFVSGDTLAMGYYQQGQLCPLISGSNVWFATKDLGRWQPNQQGENELVVIGRADNVFISGGENIHCEEIEKHLTAYPGVRQVLVTPVSDKTYGHRPVAWLDCDALEAIESYHAFLADRLEKYKWPDAVYLIPESMKQSGIKISRAQLKALAEAKVDASLD